MKIGWLPLNGDDREVRLQSELLMYQPERLNVQDKVQTCPAHTSFINKFFLIRAPWDLDLVYTYNATTQEFDIRSKKLDQQQFDLLVSPRLTSICDDGSLWITATGGYLMLADDDCMLETYPAFLHGNPFEIAMGSFNINKWQRPCDFTFKMAPNTEINIKRGDPLYYVALKPVDDSYPVLERLEETEEIMNNVNRCTGVKEFQKNASWKIATTTGNCMRPKNFLSKENTWTLLINKLKSLFK